MSKVWLITGASRGFGSAFTEAVLEAGDRVVVTAGNPEQLVELEDRYSEKVCTVPLDVTNEASQGRLRGGDRIVRRPGRAREQYRRRCSPPQAWAMTAGGRPDA